MAVAGSLTYDTKLDTKGFKEGLSKVGSATKTAFKGVGVAIGAVATAITGITVAATNAYAEYEQLVGGVETLFGSRGTKTVEEYAKEVGKSVDFVRLEFDMLQKAQKRALDDAAEAYKTAGLSANEYMETANSIAAALNQSSASQLDSAEIANRAIIDMSDNANKMGTSMEMIQHAYQGFAKQNFTMLDNLKLGYGGTKTEMERLIYDAAQMTDIQEQLGITVDESSMSFTNIVNAISVMQKKMGIAGTTAKEASSTITGSVNAMKGAFNNLLVGLANGNADLDKLISNLFESISTVATNIMPVVMTVLEQVPIFITELLTVAVEQIPTVINELIPTISEAAITILNTLIQGISDNIEVIINGAMTIVSTLINGIIILLPDVLKMGVDLLLELLKGLTQTIPEIIPVIIDVLLEMVNTIIDNIDLIASSGVDLIFALIDGLLDALPDLIAVIPDLIVALVTKLLSPEMLLKLQSVGPKLLLSLGEALIKNIPNLLLAVPKIIVGLFNSIKDTIKNTDWKKIGKNILDGIMSGIKDFGNTVKDTAKKLVDKVKNSVKDFFGIKSPSRLMRDEVGKFIPQGIAVGIEADTDSALHSIDKMNDEIMNKMNQAVNVETAKASFSGTSGSVSQILSANSVIRVENYNTLELDGEAVYNNQQTVQQRKNLQYSFGGGTSK